jgi:branched-chain amino acid transport system ATP-binding protein
MMTLLKCERVTQQFGELAAVSDLSFEVEEGEIFGIAGPNGAGKSTLFNVITGFYRGSGAIYLEDERISGLRPYQICHKGIARTFQIPQLFLTLPVYQNVRVGAYYGNLGSYNEKENIRDTIQFVGLEGKENVISGNLNLLDKKLTMVAVALATKPKLLLLDEPIGGLSPTETKDFMALVRRINQELGLTIMIIEHLMKALTALSSRMMILHNGQRICLGLPEEVISNKTVLDIYLGKKYHARSR